MENLHLHLDSGNITEPKKRHFDDENGEECARKRRSKDSDHAVTALFSFDIDFRSHRYYHL